MSDSPAAILFDIFGSQITTVSGIDGVRLGTSIKGSVGIDPLSTGGLALETTLSGVAVTTTSINAKDFATETTLSQVQSLLSTIDADTSNLDVALSTRATETTLSAFRTDFQNENFASEATLSGLSQTATAIAEKDFATETTLQTLATEATVATIGKETTLSGIAQTATFINNKDFATQTTLASLLSAFNSEDFATETTATGINTTLKDIRSNLSLQSITDNAQFTDGFTRVIPAGFILDETDGTPLTENDVAAARIDSKRALVNVLEDATVRGRRATVKGASTAAGAADSALVVAISPNNTIPISTVSGSYGGQVEGLTADGNAPIGNPIYVAGSDGTSIQALLTDSQGRLVVAPAGATSTLSGFIFGDVTLTDLGQFVVRRTTYTEPASNAQRSVASSSASDTSVGTGARQVKLTYLASDGSGPFTETITMNGTTAVNTVATNIRFIEKIEVVSVGSTGSNVGTITLFGSTGGGGGTVGTIGATHNQTFWAHHYIASGKTCFITSFSASHNGTTVGSGGVFILKALSNAANAVEVQISDFVRQYGQASNTARNYGTPIQVVGPSRVSAYCNPEGSSDVVFRASFDFYEQGT